MKSSKTETECVRASARMTGAFYFIPRSRGYYAAYQSEFPDEFYELCRLSQVRDNTRIGRACGILMLIMVCQLCHAGSADYVVREVPLLNKLPSRCVISVFQDSYGEMWFGTEEGLCRDNGYSIRVFRPQDSNVGGLTDARVNCICEHNEDEIWFGTPRGLFSLSRKTRRVSAVDGNRLGKYEINSMLAASDGSTWVSTECGVFRYEPGNREAESYVVFWKGSPTIGTRFYEDRSGRLWLMVRNGGVCLYDKSENEWKEYPWPYREAACCMVQDSRSDAFYVGTWLHGIVRFNPDALSHEQMFSAATGRNQDDERQGAIIALEQDDHRGLIWAATMRGLDVFEVKEDGGLRTVEVLERSLPMYQMITDITKDDEGNIWVAGYNIPSFVVSPVSRYENISLEEIARQSGHVATISSVCHDGSDPSLLWVFQERHRLYLYDTRSGNAVSDFEDRFEDTNNNLGNIKRLVVAGSGGVWALCHSPEMIYRLCCDKGRISVAEQVKLPPDAGILRCVYDDGSGRLHIGASGGLLEYCDGRTVWVDKGNAVSDIAGEGGLLYVIRRLSAEGKSEIAVYDGAVAVKRYVVPNDLTAISVPAGKDAIWLGDSRGEVLKLHGNKFYSLSKVSEYVPSGSVQSMFSDSCGNMWIQSEQHLTEVDYCRRHMNRYDAGDPAIGLFNFFCGSRTILPDGNILFGGTGGLCKINIHAEKPESKCKRLLITDITVDGESVDIPSGGEALELPSGCQSVNIEFAIPEHFNTAAIVYAYRIDSDKEWIQLPQGYNVIHLSNIPKGEHDFEVRRVVWGETDRQASLVPLKIIRQPKVYETWWFLAMLAAAFCLTGFILFRAWVRHKGRIQNRKMEEELIRLKFNFFTNITHELRTPLSLIITPLDALINREDNPDSKVELEGIRRNAEDLMSLINRILNFRRLEVGGEKLNVTRGNLVEFLGQVSDNFAPLAKKKGIRFSYVSTCTSLLADFDAEKFKIILNNLLGNAFKFTDRGGSVMLTLDTLFDGDGTKAVMKISDTGKGISRSHIPHILEAFYQVGDSIAADGTAGSGIGLYLVKEYVDMHGGSINIRSKENEGTEIVVMIPLGVQTVAADHSSQSEFTRNPNRQLILVTEDNDEFRSFLRRELGGRYDVIEAADGEAGLVMVRKYFPDVIVSDVMMPRMGGFEFCKKVKTDPAVCDIPVILLTARIDESSRMEGFENKADSYLTKPFRLDMLFNRIEHLTESRRRRQTEFMKQPEASPEKLELNPLDEQLLQKVMECVTRNLDNNEYSIVDLSSDMNMSRMNLYRKIMAITGQSPTDFVRTLRLKEAARMLCEGKYSISEIADATGFSSASYFTRIFKSHFGKTPTQYAEENR